MDKFIIDRDDYAKWLSNNTKYNIPVIEDILPLLGNPVHKIATHLHMRQRSTRYIVISLIDYIATLDTACNILIVDNSTEELNMFKDILYDMVTTKNRVRIDTLPAEELEIDKIESFNRGRIYDYVFIFNGTYQTKLVEVLPIIAPVSYNILIFLSGCRSIYYTEHKNHIDFIEQLIDTTNMNNMFSITDESILAEEKRAEMARLLSPDVYMSEMQCRFVKTKTEVIIQEHKDEKKYKK